MTERHPFAKSHMRRQSARIEFNAFLEQGEAAIRSVAKGVPGIVTLEKFFSFYVDVTSVDTVQVWFGKRYAGRQDAKGRLLSESGACLLYSHGPTGDVAIVLYPCKSEVARVAEDQIFIGLGSFTNYQLSARLKSDLCALSDYGHVSSLDMDSSLGQRLRVWWLRQTKPMQVNGVFVPAKLSLRALWQWIYKNFVLGLFSSLTKPLGFLIFILLLIWWGKPEWIEYIRPKWPG